MFFTYLECNRRFEHLSQQTVRLWESQYLNSGVLIYVDCCKVQPMARPDFQYALIPHYLRGCLPKNGPLDFGFKIRFHSNFAHKLSILS